MLIKGGLELERIFEADRVLKIVVAASLTSGVVGLGLSRVVDFTCPFRSVGLACPGCGCTRATLGLLDGDVSGTLSSQPTAAVLLAVLGLSVLWVAVAATDLGTVGRKLRRWSIIPLVMVLMTGVSNWIYQLVMLR